MKDFQYTFGNKVFVKKVKYEVGDLIRIFTDGPEPLLKSTKKLTKGLYKITSISPSALSRGESLVYDFAKVLSSGRLSKYQYSFHVDFIEKVSDLEKSENPT